MDPKNFEGPFGVFWAEKIFVFEFDETWYIDAPDEGDHFIIKYIFCQLINKHWNFNFVQVNFTCQPCMWGLKVEMKSAVFSIPYHSYFMSFPVKWCLPTIFAPLCNGARMGYNIWLRSQVRLRYLTPEPVGLWYLNHIS